MKSLNELVQQARRDFHDRLRIENPSDPETLAREIAKQSLPSSSKEILVLAARNLELALEEPNGGPAFDGRPNAINVIAANISEHVFRALTKPSEFQSLSDRIRFIAQAHELGMSWEEFHTEILYPAPARKKGSA